LALQVCVSDPRLRLPSRMAAKTAYQPLSPALAPHSPPAGAAAQSLVPLPASLVARA